MSRPGQTASALALLILVCLIVSLRLFDPLGGDGGLFLTAAKMLGAGGVLHVDFWDIKQPGIFYFYRLGGALFGYTYLGIQLFQAVYWAVVFAVAAPLLRPRLEQRWLAVMAPVLFLGTHFSFAPPNSMAQVEILVGGPLVISALLLSGPRSGARVALAGALGAVVLLFKLALAPILIAFLAVHSVHALKEGRGMRAMGTDLLLFCVGGGALLLAEGLHLWARGSLAEALKVAFVTGPEAALYAIKAPFGRLVDGAVVFGGMVIGSSLFVALGALARRKSELAQHMLGWLGLGLAVILIQRFSWWEYHWQLLLMPVAILAVLGIDALFASAQARGGGRLVSALAVVAALGYIAHPALGRFSELSEHAPELRRGDFTAYRAGIDPGYGRAQAAAALVAPLPDDATVYVMGDPRIYVALDKPQAVAINGWALEFASPAIWARLEKDMRGALPDAIYVDGFYRDVISRHSTALQELLRQQYTQGPRAAGGEWHLLNGE